MSKPGAAGPSHFLKKIVGLGVGLLLVGVKEMHQVFPVVRVARKEQFSAVFVDEMNRYGTEVLGLTGSHFSCPDGYHKDDHYTTITDIMTVAYAALSEPLIMKYAGLYHDDVTFASGHSTSWSNGNKLLNPNSPYYYKYATGIKTGFTEEAGYCLVSCAELGEKKVMAGVFGAENNYGRFTDSKNLLTAGIER